MRTDGCWSDYGVNVSGTRVDASNVKFDIKADDQSEP